MLKLETLLEATEAKKPLKFAEEPYYLAATDCKLNLIGDVHGAKYWYQDVCYKADYSIQLGDIHNSPLMRSYFGGLDANKHKYIHGNHDWIKGKATANYLGPFGIWTIDEYDLKIGFISGAYSVDRAARTHNNYDPVHEHEELSTDLLQKAIDLMVEEQPDVIVSHTAPLAVYDKLRLIPHFGKIRSRTSQALSIVLEECSPSLWAFGHFHQDVHFTYQDRVTFACVNIATTLPFH